MDKNQLADELFAFCNGQDFLSSDFYTMSVQEQLLEVNKAISKVLLMGEEVSIDGRSVKHSSLDKLQKLRAELIAELQQISLVKQKANTGIRLHSINIY